MVREVPLTKGFVALVDDADYELVLQYDWIAQVNNTGHVYARSYEGRGRGRKPVYMHRLIARAEPGVQVDHDDRDTLNNRRGNLRSATVSQNHANAGPGKRNRLGFKGIRQDGPAAFRAYVMKEGKTYFGGTHKTSEDAARAYDRLATELFGEYAATNKKLGLLHD
jgi:hypothetical protein